MRPVWGSRLLFVVRAVLVTLAALVLVVWAVAAPRFLSPSPTPPSATPKASASKPLKVPIGSFLGAQPSISNESSLSKHASGSSSSGVAGVETRVIDQATSESVVFSISDAKAKGTPKDSRRVSKGDSQTTTDSTPAVAPPTTTNTTLAVAPPAAAPVTAPVTAAPTKARTSHNAPARQKPKKPKAPKAPKTPGSHAPKGKD